MPMSLPESSQKLLFAAGNELPDLLPDDDPMIIFSRVIYPSFNDQEFEDCYSEKGRPAISPAFLACVTMLQFRENLSDCETAKAVVRRLDWKIALHLPIWENVSFDPSTLTYFRRRLKENGKMRLLFDKTIDLAQTYGFLRHHTNQRIDATHIVTHTNRISTTDLLFRTVRCVVEEIGKREPEMYRDEIPEYLKDRYTNDFSSFGMSKEKRHDRQAEIIEDGLRLQSIITERFGERVDEFKQLKIMETIFEENVEIKKKHQEMRRSSR
jgi:transposase